MYLSRISTTESTAKDPATWRLFSSPYLVHRAVWRLFADDSERKRDFLYRVSTQPVGARLPMIFTLSSRLPRRDGKGIWQVDTKEFKPKLDAGDRLRFLLRANPVVTRNGKRHDVVMDAKSALRSRDIPRADWPSMAELTQEAGKNWLERRAAKCGFALLGSRVESYRTDTFRKPGHQVRISTCDFDGVLTVTYPEEFLSVWKGGIGPAKGFGCGLLLCKRA